MSSSKSLSYPVRVISAAVFAVSMGYFEAMVVVYLRELYYPEGFSFPLKLMPSKMIILEVIREAATVVMLFSVSVLAGRRLWERFGYFIFMFGIWDIFFYIWLKVTIDWPSSLFDRDILFLIPIPWIGPVIAPLTVAVMMVLSGMTITWLLQKGYAFKPARTAWITAVLGTMLILYSFMKDTGAAFHQNLPEPYEYPFLVIGIVLYIVAYWVSCRARMR